MSYDDEQPGAARGVLLGKNSEAKKEKKMTKTTGIEAVLELMDYPDDPPAPYPALVVNGGEVLDFEVLKSTHDLSAAAYRAWLATMETAAEGGQSRQIAVDESTLRQWGLSCRSFGEAVRELAAAEWLEICETKNDRGGPLVSLRVVSIVHRRRRETQLPAVLSGSWEEVEHAVWELAEEHGQESTSATLPAPTEEDVRVLRRAVVGVLLRDE